MSPLHFPECGLSPPPGGLFFGVLTVGIDELKFLASSEINAALATIAHRENVRTNVHGGEQWEGTRTMTQLEQGVICVTRC